MEFTCAMCKETFALEGDLPEQAEGEVLICRGCMEKLQSALSMLAPTGSVH